MATIGNHSYKKPGFKIADHDLSGEIDNVDLTLFSDGTYKSWSVLLRGIETSACGVISDIFNNGEIADLAVEQKEVTKTKDPSFSGRVLVKKIVLAPKSAFIELRGTGPVNFLA